jgi:outer membrane lipoprotein-sorting protein
MGKPAVTLAVQKKDGDLVVANVRRKKAKVYPLKALEQEQAAMGFSFIEAGFPKSLAEFEKNFSVKEVETVDGIHRVTVTINDRRTSVGLRKMVFFIAADSHDLRGFYLRFRDSSSITTRFTGVKKNPGIPQDEFKLDLSSYETTVHGEK